jgi:lysosomal alpha-mannosidase
MALGHEFLKKEFGVIPTVGWHIDPFGHSAANAAMYYIIKILKNDIIL